MQANRFGLFDAVINTSVQLCKTTLKVPSAVIFKVHTICLPNVTRGTSLAVIAQQSTKSNFPFLADGTSQKRGRNYLST